ncbi:hypothetical protein BLNAU_22158 [Blattamonas nauphoetae]|uniref:Uncharacterized protein n=1 Tax=Blattamonas nauphoetae TaxID=2049346 RepID=A0ABQ9WTX4_9EUKA|nr:hypothetical protein BLNAU_22158 [Blattamonas nauphoetae]
MQPSARVETPLFQRIEPNTITTLHHFSPPFMSLVDFVRQGNTLDDTATERACTILEMIKNQTTYSSAAKWLFSQLVPTSRGSSSGFVESFVVLLTSSNEKLVNTTLSFLQQFVHCFDLGQDQFTVLKTGFFQLLPQSFYEQEMHLVTQPSLSLMRIVNDFLVDLDPHNRRSICDNRHLSISTFNETFTDKFFRPLQPFLAFICSNRRRISDSEESHPFSQLLTRLVKYSPHLEELTQFVLSSSFALTFTDCLPLFDTNFVMNSLLTQVTLLTRAWRKDSPDNQKRGQQIMARLCEESFLDEIELLIRVGSRDFTARRFIFTGATLMHNLGGNVPFEREVEDERLEADLDEEWAFNWDDGRENDWDYDWGSDLGGNVPFMGAVEDERLEEESEEESDEI